MNNIILKQVTAPLKLAANCMQPLKMIKCYH